MQAISLRDLIWAVALGGGAAWLLGRYLVRAVRRGRCAGCSEPGCATRATGAPSTAPCQPLKFSLGEAVRDEAAKEAAAKGEGQRADVGRDERRGLTARQFHGLVAVAAFPFLLLLLGSGIGLLFDEELELDRRPLPAALALPFYGGAAGRVVAVTRGDGGEAVAATDGVITRSPGGPWRGVATVGTLGTVHDVAWLGDGHLAAATERGLWISADGSRWDYLADGGAGLPGPVTRVVAVAGEVWAKSALGPRLSVDGGVSWRPASGPSPSALDAPPVAMVSTPAGGERAWLAARGWPTWERFMIDLHGGHLLGGRWRAGVLFSWLLLLGLAISGPLVARARRRHQRQRAARQPARVVAATAGAGSTAPEGGGLRLGGSISNGARQVAAEAKGGAASPISIHQG